MAEFLNESNGAKTSARDNGSGSQSQTFLLRITAKNPLFVKGLQGEPYSRETRSSR